MVFIIKTWQNAAIFRNFCVLRFFWRLCENDEKEAENSKKALKIGEKWSRSSKNRWKNGPGAPWASPERSRSSWDVPGVLKKAKAKKRRISGQKNQRPGGPKRVFWGPKWRKKTPKSTKNWGKFEAITEKRASGAAPEGKNVIFSKMQHLPPANHVFRGPEDPRKA